MPVLNLVNLLIIYKCQHLLSHNYITSKTGCSLETEDLLEDVEVKALGPGSMSLLGFHNHNLPAEQPGGTERLLM